MTEYFGSETVVIDGDVRSVADVLDHDENVEVLYPVVHERRAVVRPVQARMHVGEGVLRLASIRPTYQEQTVAREQDYRERQFKDN